MIVSFPIMLPDELFYSCCARYHNESGNEVGMHTLGDLFGNPHMLLDPTYPKGLDFFVSQMSNIISVSQIINEHSILPVILPFLDRNRLDLLFKSFRGEGKNYANHILGIKNTLRITSLKYCRMCLINDDEKFGVPFWHRSHHLPGIHSCLIHQISLESQCPVCLAQFKPQKGHLTRLNRYCENGHDLTKVVRINNSRDEHGELMKGLAQDVSYIFHLNESSYKWSEIYALGLKELGYSGENGRVNLVGLRGDMQKKYPASFLARLGCQIDKDGGWLTSIYLKKQAVFHPIQHLLLIRFLFGSMGELLALLNCNGKYYQDKIIAA